MKYKHENYIHVVIIAQDKLGVLMLANTFRLISKSENDVAKLTESSVAIKASVNCNRETCASETSYILPSSILKLPESRDA